MEDTPPADISENNLLTPNTQAVFGGFWKRLLAFVIDLIIINLFLNLASYVIKDFFYSLAQYGRVFGCFLAFCYFTIFDSSLLGGHTLGKQIIKLKTLSKDLQPLTLAQSTLRTLFKLPFFYLPEIFTLIFSENLSFKMIPISLAIMGLSFSYLASTIMIITLHPQKRSIHDIVAGSYVFNDQADLNSEIIFEQTPLLAKKISYSYTMTTVVFCCLFLIMGYQKFNELKKQKEEITTIIDMHTSIQDQFNIKKVSLSVQSYQDDDPTTSTKNLKLDDKETTSTKKVNLKEEFIIGIVQWSELDPEEIKKDKEKEETSYKLARFVFDNYPSIDKLSRINVVYMGFYDILFHKNKNFYSFKYNIDKNKNILVKEEDKKIK